MLCCLFSYCRCCSGELDVDYFNSSNAVVSAWINDQRCLREGATSPMESAAMQAAVTDSHSQNKDRADPSKVGDICCCCGCC